MAIEVLHGPRRIARPVLRAVDGTANQHAAVGVLFALTSLTCGALLVWPQQTSSAPLVPIVVAAGLFLRAVQMYAVFAAAGLCLAVAAFNLDSSTTSPTLLAALAVVMLLLVAVDRRRASVGISTQVGTSMLVDLRDRLRAQGTLPELPDGWHAESSIQPAHGDAFSGDFLVTNRAARDKLELALVDVSGKGTQAGSRSLMLSSALAGLIGEMDPKGFLPAANSYLVRQAWTEGFATAVHLEMDTDSGRYTVGSAGHPCAVHFQAGSGRWAPVEGAAGVLLGVLDSDEAEFPRGSGVLERGDALLLYTDGVIESRDTDLDQGLDRMLGAADRAMAQQRPGVADRICASARAGETDDRAAVLIWRD